MFCPECGTNNDDHAAFCCNCGTPLQPLESQTAPGFQNTTGFQNTMVSQNVSVSLGKEKQGLTTGDKLLLAELAIAVLSVIIFIVVYQTQLGAKNVAQKYAEAVFGRDWNTVYDKLYIEDSSEFLTKEAFITAQQMNTPEEKQRVRIKSVKKIIGGFSSQAYRVSYRTEDYSDAMTIELKRCGLLWKIETDEYFSKNYMVTVPAGANVMVDKIDITKELKPSTKKDGYDTYTVPLLFGSTHYIELGGDELEDYAQCLTFIYTKGDDTENVTASIVNAPYNEKTIKKVMKQAAKDLEEILNAASENTPFSEADVFKEVDPARAGDIGSSYNDLRDYVFGNADSSYALTKYQLTNGETTGYMNPYEHVIQVDIKGNYKYENASLSYDGSHTTTDKGDGTCTHTLQYMNVDGEWTLFGMDLDMGGVY